MSPMVKYTLIRLGLFGIVAALLFAIPVEMSPLLRLMIAVLISAVVSFILLKRLRDDVARQMLTASKRRAEEKERLRTALADDENGAEDGAQPSASS